MSLKDRAQATMDAGYRGFRVDASIGGAIPDGVFNTHERVRLVAQACKEIREGVGHGDWMIDFHQKFDFADALRCCKLIEEYEPYFVEDPVRDEHFLQDIPKLRGMTTCPLTAGEEWGNRWDFNKLVENHDIDYIRATLPNVGGITEMMKIAALCETHSVGIVPHFTGPDLDRGAGRLSLHVHRSGRDGVQLRRPSDSISARVPGFQAGQGVYERPSRPRRDRRFKAVEADQFRRSAGPREHLPPSRRLADALVEAKRQMTSS